MLLTVVVYMALAVAKSRAAKEGLVDLERRALHSDAWPESVQKINNNIRNQFEVPVLFYVLAISLFVLGAAGLVAQALAWVFVASRIADAYIHIGTNHVSTRRTSSCSAVWWFWPCLSSRSWPWSGEAFYPIANRLVHHGR